ncbi:MAG: hypothetical protein CAPSK01_002366 [Candidatus Accumulibacter vicinus]|uniref:Uncharacterized protein n=1 Tax=Candidatus Accumulibacter vicinus TaxID=2954382 RepID=A0A084XZ84_9PROT|nr:MAG: hypothetical protein CAPSK01_002366 [Candidatus Accumulibacter vicinus]
MRRIRVVTGVLDDHCMRDPLATLPLEATFTDRKAVLLAIRQAAENAVR